MANQNKTEQFNTHYGIEIGNNIFYKLRKISVNNGSTSDISDNWQTEMSLRSTPELDKSLEWEDLRGNIGNSSSIQSIIEQSNGLWFITTHTSTYELSRLNTSVDTLDDVFDIGEILQNQNTPQEVLAALSIESFYPVDSVRVEGYEFWISNTFDFDRREIAIGYILDKNNICHLRMFYKSNSDGGWRLNAPNSTQTFAKGIVDNHGYRHYSKETKPHEELVSLLEKLPKNSYSNDAEIAHLYREQCKIRDLYKNQEHLDQYIQETGGENFPKNYFSSLMGIGLYVQNRISRGQVWGEEQLSIKKIQNINFPSGFIPDFNRTPIHTYYQSHTIFSEKDEQKRVKQDIQIEIYESSVKKVDGSYEILTWHMATSPKEKVWIDKIVPESSHINSFGIQNKIFDFGLLDLKPVDYSDQVLQIPDTYKNENLKINDLNNPFVKHRMKDGVLPDYQDITPFLAELEPIRQYKKARTGS